MTPGRQKGDGDYASPTASQAAEAPQGYEGDTLFETLHAVLPAPSCLYLTNPITLSPKEDESGTGGGREGVIGLSKSVTRVSPMHSHDRTLLSQLGFADKDKQNPLHDLAGQYLAQAPQSERICALLGAVTFAARSATELVLTKGHDQYQTVIGFVDVAVCGFTEKGPRMLGLVDVKIAECSAGDVLRQLGLYRQFAVTESGRYTAHPFWPGAEVAWIVAVAFQPTQAFADTLKAAGVRLIRLGPKFQEWAKAQQAAVAEVEEV